MAILAPVSLRSLGDDFVEAAERALSSGNCIVPMHWPFEVANVLALAERRQRITQEGISEFLDTLRRLPIQIERREASHCKLSPLSIVNGGRKTRFAAVRCSPRGVCAKSGKPKSAIRQR